jgi:nicotinate-nucleotide adenylyltransferase
MIGIYGGSFDPIHLGHLAAATFLKSELNLEKCLLMPCALPVHKAGLYYSDNQRLDMLNLATEDYSELEVDEREITRGGDSYTIDTLKELKDEQPSETFCLIIGMDSFIQFKSWKQWSEFFNYAHIVVLGRPGYEAESLNLTSFEATQNKQHLAERQNGLLYFSKCPLIDVSSSKIRGKMAANKNLDDFLPKTIINYLETISIKNNDT